MVASFQRLTTLALLTASVLWLLACFMWQASSWLYLGAALIAFNHVIVLFMEFAMLRLASDESGIARPSTRTLLRAWLRECLVTPTVFYWRQPFRSHLYPDTLVMDAGQGLRAGGAPAVAPVAPLVLVHGFGCNRGVWLPVLKRLHALAIPYTAINLEPMLASIDEYLPAIDRAVRSARAATGLAPVVVGHSMGGIAVRAWISGLEQSEAVGAVSRVITIGSPHHGTCLARFARGINASQMQRGSAWLTSLSRRGSPALHAMFTCFYSNADNIVVPASSGMLEGARNVHLHGLAHIELAFAEAVFAELLRWSSPEPGGSKEGRAAIDR